MTNIGQDLEKEIASIKSAEDFKQIRSKYLGAKGIIKGALKELANMSIEEKKVRGPLIQQAKKEAENILDEKEKQLQSLIFDRNLSEQAEDLDMKLPKIGHLHPITHTINKLDSFFSRMGYSIMDGSEIETDEYCFQRLNVPTGHPARDMQDTLYIKEPHHLLRTQTSSIEAHILEENKPPFKAVCSGRVYRNERVNSSNHFVFHHYQGVVVLEKVSLKDLFGTFDALFKEMYGPDVVVRYRNKYYPEVEPGVGPDMRCFGCQGKGCTICKGVGWIEMGGAGIIHPNVLEMANIDKDKWMGFAFGLGLDRWVMAKYNIHDIRTLLGGNLGYKYYENENTI